MEQMQTDNCMEILFYIIVPVYNVEKYLDGCVRSVLNQSYKNFKLILINDGSSDHCGIICNQYAKKYNNIHVIHQVNQGQIAARQAGLNYVMDDAIKQEKSIFVMYLDSDDSLKKNALQVIQKSIKKYQCDLIFFGMDRVLNGKVVEPFNYKKNFLGIIKNKRDLYNLVLNDSRYNSLCRKAISVSLCQKIDYSPYYSIRHGEDLLQSLEIYKLCNKVVFLKDPLYNYTINPLSVTQNITPKNFKIDSTLLKLVWDFIQKEKAFKPDDIDLHISYSRRILREKVHIIAGFNISDEEKKKFFMEITEDSYYKTILNGVPITNLTLWMLVHNYYNGIIALFSGYQICRKIKKMMFRK